MFNDTIVYTPTDIGWSCDTCGALVLFCSTHTRWHLKQKGEEGCNEADR